MTLVLKFGETFRSLPLKTFSLRPIFCVQSYQTVKCYAQTSFGSDIKVIKDVILFKYDNPKFYKYLNIFAVAQFMFWGFMGNYSVSSIRDVPVAENVNTNDLPWWRKINLGESKYKRTLQTTCYFLGFAILACSWMFTVRSVRYLILNKGGDKVSIVTYTPHGINRIMTVPINKISSIQSRESATSTLPIRVFGHRFYYLLDMRGEFRNPQLFDRTAGILRNF